jgi:MinD-like ATPase involved in chromosome partitioning or flagellar assembly
MSRIITFYSYKGGVGRTLALANIGVLLAKRNKHVLLMDWDLEAPGLDRYFRPYLSDRFPKDRGTIHLLQEALASPVANWRDHVQEFTVLSENTSPRTSFSLSLISSGVASPEYAQKVRGFSWVNFIEEKDGGSTLERWRDEWKREFDFILIDSRTGITDTGGICTILLPDFLVLVFSSNDQSFEGALGVAQSIERERRDLAVPRHPLTILPLLSRFDRTQEVELADRWLMRFARDLKPFYDDWLPGYFDSPLEILELTKVPYVTLFSFGEPLPVLTHSLTEPQFPGFYLENAARLLATDFSVAEEIVGRRAAPTEERSSGLSTRPRVFISYSHDSPEHSARVLALAQQLRLDGIDGNLDQFHNNKLIDWRRWYEEQLRPGNSDFVLTICSAEYKRRIESGADANAGHGVFWEGGILSKQLHEDKAMSRFIPILLDDEPEDSLLTPFRGFTWFRVRGFGVQSGDEGYNKIYRLLTNQPNVIKAHTGRIKPLPSQEQETAAQLEILRRRVKEYWVDGVLRHSLYNEVLISLGMRHSDEFIDAPWKFTVEVSDAIASGPLVDRNINAIFDATGLLLILGEPGSGKSTTLLDLAGTLLDRAGADIKERVPIVLNLSSWKKKQALAEWISGELSEKYRVPRKIARFWLERDYLVPLLDGLDEIETSMQPECVAAINAFIEELKPSGLVICCQLNVYQWLPGRLKLNGAILLEPLSKDEVAEYLTAAGSKLAALREAVDTDPVLQEMAQTPLMLSIMSLAFQGADGDDLATQKGDSLEERRKQVFSLYIEQMFRRKGTTSLAFPKEKIIGWLSWLARKMREHSQSVFLVEGLQPSWLGTTAERVSYGTVVALSLALISGLIAGLTAGLIGGIGGLRETSGWLSHNLSYGLAFVLSILAGIGLVLNCAN